MVARTSQSMVWAIMAHMTAWWRTPRKRRDSHFTSTKLRVAKIFKQMNHRSWVSTYQSLSLRKSRLKVMHVLFSKEVIEECLCLLPMVSGHPCIYIYKYIHIHTFIHIVNQAIWWINMNKYMFRLPLQSPTIGLMLIKSPFHISDLDHHLASTGDPPREVKRHRWSTGPSKEPAF